MKYRGINVDPLACLQIADAGGLPALVALLRRPVVLLAEQAARALGNLASGGSENLRDRIFEAGALPALVEVLEREGGPLAAHVARCVQCSIVGCWRYQHVSCNIVRSLRK